MPLKPNKGRVPKHDHQWYPISFGQDGEPVLWACGVQRRCIDTRTRTLKGRGKNRRLTPPEPTIPSPYQE